MSSSRDQITFTGAPVALDVSSASWMKSSSNRRPKPPPRYVGAGIGGVPPEKVKVHTTYLGGGFGRRFELDFIQEALETSKATGAPVKVIWSREDDIRNAQYRPACYHKMQAGLDASGQPVAWTHRIVAPSIMARVFPDSVKNGLDGEAVEGG